MAEYQMAPEPALGALSKVIGEGRLTEVTNAHLMTVSIPMGEEAATARALSERLGCELPEVGKSVQATPAGTTLLRLNADRVMVLSQEAPVNLSSIGYQVDQSDYWTMLELSGPATLPAMERTCRLNLSQENFPLGAVARTSTEGIATILVRQAVNEFLLMTPRSFARSFAHVLEKSLGYVRKIQS